MKIRAASYARKSNAQDVSEEDKSVGRQAELARAFAKTKGWTLAGEYADDGISGRLKTKLVSRNRMLADALAEKFTILIVRDLDRLSRDDEELPGLIYTLRDAGIEVWCYADGQRVDTETAMNRGMLTMRSTFSAAEGEKASERTREQKRGRHAKTPSADGKVYGYRNVGEPKQRRREIEPTQAKTVVRIFEMSAEGLGLLKITRALNAEKVRSPSGHIPSTETRQGWHTTGVREILHRDLYRGIAIYGKTTWKYSKGDKHKVDVPEAQWLRVPAPELRIVSEVLWTRVHDRLARVHETYPGRKANGRLQGRREAGLVSQYLLSGFLRCGICGGNLIVVSRSGRGGVKKYFICTVAHHRGQDICANVKGAPYEALTQAIVETFKTNFFNPVALGKLLIREIEQRSVAPEAAKAEAEALRREVDKLGREIARGVQIALEGSGEVAGIAEALRAKERQKADLSAKLEHLDGLQQAAEGFDVVAWTRETAELLEDTRNLLDADPAAGRQLLRLCLPGPIRVTPDGAEGWIYEGEGVFSTEAVRSEVRGIRGRIGSPPSDPPKLVPPAGSAHQWAGSLPVAFQGRAA